MAEFHGRAGFEETRFEKDARLGGARFQGSPQLGPLVCRGTVDLASAVFSVAVTLELAAYRVDCRHTRWTAKAALRLRHAAVNLGEAMLEFPVSVAAHPPFTVQDSATDDAAPHDSTLDESGLSESIRHGSGLDEAPVRMASLHGVDASHLVLTDIDLRECRFAGTIHLDQLRLYGRCTFPGTPTGLRRRGPLPLRWTSRQTLAEEQYWRASREGPESGWLADPEGRPAVRPEALAPVYRDLRKGFEDAKNEPGAADFYYGEMGAA
ncbi:hypothetical protein [Streptomyces sp. ODS28]|uniref:hypothetical protein n=1 Tax=Streptomyces sp. ODS28 TaxID=3136688 RepID=UPI0031E8CB12